MPKLYYSPEEIEELKKKNLRPTSDEFIEIKKYAPDAAMEISLVIDRMSDEEFARKTKRYGSMPEKRIQHWKNFVKIWPALLAFFFICFIFKEVWEFQAVLLSYIIYGLYTSANIGLYESECKKRKYEERKAREKEQAEKRKIEHEANEAEWTKRRQEADERLEKIKQQQEEADLRVFRENLHKRINSDFSKSSNNSCNKADTVEDHDSIIEAVDYEIVDIND